MKLTIEGTLLEILAVVGGDINIEQDNLDPAPGHPELALAPNLGGVSSNLGAIPSHLPKPPEPPAGHKWAYRGKGWEMKNVQYAYFNDGIWRISGHRSNASGIESIHYLEAVPLTPEPVAGVSDIELGRKFHEMIGTSTSYSVIGKAIRELLTGKGGDK